MFWCFHIQLAYIHIHEHFDRYYKFDDVKLKQITQAVIVTIIRFWRLPIRCPRLSIHLSRCFRVHTRPYRSYVEPLLWRHNGQDSVSNRQPHDCLLNRLFRRRSKKTSKLRVTGLCAGNSPGTGELPAQKASNAENVSIWWRHHVWLDCGCIHEQQDSFKRFKTGVLTSWSLAIIPGPRRPPRCQLRCRPDVTGRRYRPPRFLRSYRSWRSGSG